jgi:hypothetical protein
VPFLSNLNLSETALQDSTCEHTHEQVESSRVKFFERLVELQRCPAFLTIHCHTMVRDAKAEAEKCLQCLAGIENYRLTNMLAGLGKLN